VAEAGASGDTRSPWHAERGKSCTGSKNTSPAFDLRILSPETKANLRRGQFLPLGSEVLAALPSKRHWRQPVFDSSAQAQLFLAQFPRAVPAERLFFFPQYIFRPYLAKAFYILHLDTSVVLQTLAEAPGRRKDDPNSSKAPLL